MKYCKMEDCQYCEYSTWAEMYVCALTNEEVFEEHLKEIHSLRYAKTDDPDEYEEWRAGLEVEDVIQFANEFFKTLQTSFSIYK